MENEFLNIPEEVALLTLGEDGEIHPKIKSPKFDIVIAASILMDLALHNRIDTDMKNIIPDKLEPMNDPILDVVIEELKEKGGPVPIKDMISELSLMGQFFRDEIGKSLLAKKVLKVENKKVMWMFSKKVYPVVNDQPVKEVSARIRDLVFSNEIPDPRDIVILSIFKYADLLDVLFTEEELKDYEERINQIAKMDMIGLAIGEELNRFKLSGIKNFLKGEDKTPEEMLEEHVRELKEKFRITDNSKLPAWLRRGTPQYEKTLEFVREKGTADITYNHRTNTYHVNSYSFSGHEFGSGG
jgi:hypothetical protein